MMDIAVVGANTLAGEALLALLAERAFPLRHLYLLAAEEAVGVEVEFRRRSLWVENIAEFDFSRTRIAFFMAGSAIAATYAPQAAAAGCLVIDSSACFRQDPLIPLVVPEVNVERIADYTAKNIIACPSSVTVMLAVALKPITDAVGIRQINVSTYHALSDLGSEAVEALARQTSDLLNFRPVKPVLFPHQFAFNVLPQVGDFLANGYSKEEMQIGQEMRKMMNDEALPVNVTAVQVPVFYGHSLAIQIETGAAITVAQARALWQGAPGIQLAGLAEYPTAVSSATGRDVVRIGRIREVFGARPGLNLWVVADNLRKGIALNSLQIAEVWVNQYTY